MNFVALDVETANADMAAICQIGIARFANAVMTDEWKSYIDPQDYFDGIKGSIHGIDEAVVAGAPTFGALVNTINGLLNGHVVVHAYKFRQARDLSSMQEVRERCHHHALGLSSAA